MQGWMAWLVGRDCRVSNRCIPYNPFKPYQCLKQGPFETEQV
jgi:hypothetical protein